MRREARDLRPGDVFGTDVAYEVIEVKPICDGLFVQMKLMLCNTKSLEFLPGENVVEVRCRPWRLFGTGQYETVEELVEAA
jgi:hypothetical protein